ADRDHRPARRRAPQAGESDLRSCLPQLSRLRALQRSRARSRRHSARRVAGQHRAPLLRLPCDGRARDPLRRAAGHRGLPALAEDPDPDEVGTLGADACRAFSVHRDDRGVADGRARTSTLARLRAAAHIRGDLVARTDAERRQVLAAIGPVWDGNEVWLIAAGGTLFFAFPVAYAAAFSGFYLPLMLVLWLLILRGISIEFRSHLANPLWRPFWDAVFALASLLLAVVLGAALGNVLRGVGLDGTGSFSTPLFST